MARLRAGHFSMQKTPLLLVTTGAESSGKTTLARQLADHLQAPLVEECSRPYLEARYREQADYQYQHEDLLRIADWQRSAEQAAMQQYPEAPYIVSDTDLLVLLIWEAVRFKTADQTLHKQFCTSLQQQPRHYFLCHWDIPWEADPLRENPHDRDQLYQRYRQTLIQYDLAWSELKGPPAQRLNTALGILGSLAEVS